MNNFLNIVKVDLIGMFGINKFLYEKKSKKKIIGFALLFLYLGFFIISASCMYSNILSASLSQINATQLTMTIMMTSSCILTLVSCVTKASTILFKNNNYDVIMSFPIKLSTVIATKIFTLYVMNFLFVLVVMIPAFVFYTIYEGFAFLVLIKYIVTLFLIPIIPVIIGTFISVIVSLLSSRFRCSNFINIIFNALFFFLVMFISFFMTSFTSPDNSSTEINDIAITISNKISSVYMPSSWYTKGVFENDNLMFMAFVGISAVLLAAFIFVLSRKYKYFCNMVSGKFTKGNYKISKQKSKGVLKALYVKELKRYFASYIYVLNTGLGIVILLIAAIASLFIDPISIFSDELAIVIPFIGYLLPYGVTLTTSTICTTCSSISIEGKNFWILKTLPVRSMDVFKSKILFNLTLQIPTIIISDILLIISFKLNLLQTVLMLLTTLSFSFFTSVFGLFVNIKSHRFDWKNEVAVVKQSIATLLGMFIPMSLSIIPAILALNFSEHIPLISIGSNLIIIVVTIILYKLISKVHINSIN